MDWLLLLVDGRFILLSMSTRHILLLSMGLYEIGALVSVVDSEVNILDYLFVISNEIKKHVLTSCTCYHS